MKGIKQIFAGCLALLVFSAPNIASADDADTIARAATRRGATTTVSREQSAQTSDTQKIESSGISRSTNLNQSGQSVRNRTQSNTSSRANVVVRDGGTRTSTETSNQSTTTRSATNVLPRATVSKSSVVSTPSRTAVSRNAVSTVSRTANINRTDTNTSANGARSATATISRAASVSRAATTPQTHTTTTARRTGAAQSARVSRAGTLSAEEIINRDYTKCREVYYSCMDEFCANKDSQLKRCACSSRVNEFDDIKEQLATVEDKLLDFNQRLLTVNMDKEDAESIFQATEGELAFQQEDTSSSKELLDEISEKLNATFDTSSFDTDLSPISLSLNAAAAFDTVDSLAGASTTTKSGTELYSAALPVCREMALEVCTPDELDIIESGYQMAIEQDCNTVAKAYQTQQDLAREKIREGSALLDISRLDTYQKNNSDDILTCKKKMLDMLTDTSVCGDDLQQCLDISGQYIDPSTGEAILTSNLANLGNLITRPDSNQTWTGAPGNAKFVSYLNSKKKYLESATENCQDIADSVWDAFLEDALAQIKLAQESKLEEVRQSCTTLTTQCLSDAAESLEDFDARALSIFGVQADKTVKQMCSEVQSACTALLNTVDSGDIWNEGMTEIATDKTYDTIMQTCREVGRNCIIQSCKSISGNFGLCEDIQTSVNRKAIINRTACWDEVLECVADAGTDAINKITELQIADGAIGDNGSFYKLLYGDTNTDITNDELQTNWSGTSCTTTDKFNCIYDICADDCGMQFATNDDGTLANDITYTKVNTPECQICRLAEKVWGNCEAHPVTNLSAADSHNQIKMPVDEDTETLLSWFAKNTGTDDEVDSCRDTSCGPGYISQWDSNKQTSYCVSRTDVSDDGLTCPTNTYWRVPTTTDSNNCCRTPTDNDPVAGARDSFGNCCLGKIQSSIQGVNWNATSGYWGNENTTSNIPADSTEVDGKIDQNGGLCLPDTAKFVVAFKPPSNNTYYGPADIAYLFCNGTMGNASDETSTFPSGKTLNCNGNYIVVIKKTNGGTYISPQYDNVDAITQIPTSFYRGDQSTCTNGYNDGKGNWGWATNNGTACDTPTNWIIEYSGGG